MANILFKRGLHKNLPTTAVDGAFYLTTDSHRLYVGVGTELVDLNKYIRTVATISGLENLTDSQLGDFAYIQGGNILAVYQNVDGTNKWVQINKNTDTTNSTLAFSGSGDVDNAVLELTLTDSDGGTVTDSITFIGTKGVDTSIDADGNITIQGCTYTLGGALTDGTFTVTLDSSDDTESADSNVKLVAGDHITFTTPTDTTNTLKISADDMGLAASGHTFTVNANGGAEVKIKDNTGAIATATLANNSLFYKVGAGETKESINNQGELPVYTISEIDSMMKDLNPMKYKGTVNTAEALNGKTSVQIGDTYMASAPFNLSEVTHITGVNGATTCKIGDLFIATGEENAGTLTSVTWTYVPAGDDSQTDTTYKGKVTTADHKINIENNNGSAVAGIDLDPGEDGKITLSSTTYELTSGGQGMKTVIGHAAPGADDSENKKKTGTAQESYVFNTVTDVKPDVTGHVSEYTVSNITVPKAKLTGATATASGNIATVTDTLGDSAGNALGTSTFKLDASANDNLSITASGNTVNIQLEWGAF